MIKDDNKRVSVTIKAYRERIRKLRKGRIDEVIDEMLFFAWDGDEFSGESKLYENKEKKWTTEQYIEYFKQGEKEGFIYGDRFKSIYLDKTVYHGHPEFGDAIIYGDNSELYYR